MVEHVCYRSGWLPYKPLFDGSFMQAPHQVLVSCDDAYACLNAACCLQALKDCVGQMMHDQMKLAVYR